MVQVAYCELDPAETHLVVGFPSATTLCGRLALKYGESLPVNEKQWPDPSVPWCQRCVAAYTGES